MNEVAWWQRRLRLGRRQGDKWVTVTEAAAPAEIIAEVPKV